MKDVPGYEGLYKISSKGEVFNNRGNKLALIDVKGYLRVGLRKEGISKVHRVHRLVAKAFIPNPDGLPQVDHLDEDKTNNTKDNLRWCSNKDNSTWYYTNNPKVISTGNAPKSICIDGVKYPSCGSAAKYIADATGKNKATISKELRRVLNGQRVAGTMYGKFQVSK